MKRNFKYAIFATLLFGMSGFNSAKAITADEVLVGLEQFAAAINQVFVQVNQVLTELNARVDDNDARIAALEAEPKATLAVVHPTPFDDINAGFTEGSIWVDTTENDAYILVDSAPGAAVWQSITNKTVAGPPGIVVGGTGPAGGIIFYVTEDGLHGFEASPVDLGTAEWGCPDTFVGANEFAIGTGAQNTADILAGCATPGIAARLADAYTLNGFDDWFLPSGSELGEIYRSIGGRATFGSKTYWASSGYISSPFEGRAHVVSFEPRILLPQVKGNIYSVRAIRAF